MFPALFSLLCLSLQGEKYVFAFLEGLEWQIGGLDGMAFKAANNLKLLSLAPLTPSLFSSTLLTVIFAAKEL